MVLLLKLQIVNTCLYLRQKGHMHVTRGTLYTSLPALVTYVHNDMLTNISRRSMTLNCTRVNPIRW